MLTADYSVLFFPSPWSFTCQLHLCMRTAGMWTMKLALQQYITIRQDFGAETKLIPQQLPVLGFPSTVMLYNSMLFPLPSCSILASVITLTFPPLHLPPSSSSVSSLPPLLTVALSLSLSLSLPIVTPSHSSRSENSITIKMFVWAGRWGVAGGEAKTGGFRGEHYWPVTVCVSGTVLPGDPAPAESHLHTRQLDKHKWEELVDVKAPSTL